MVCLEILIVAAVQQEVCQIGNNSFCAFGFQQIYDIVVGSRQKFYKNLTDYADTRLLFIGNRQVVKVTNDLTAHFLVTRFFHFSCNALAEPGTAS